MMGTCRLIPLHVILILLTYNKVISGRDVRKVGFCTGTAQTVGVQSLGCQQTYDLLNLTLQTNTKRTPCSILWNVFESSAVVHKQECYLPYADTLLAQIVQKNYNCSKNCEKNFPYSLRKYVSDVADVAACCSGKPEDCVVDQLWLYYECDSPLTKVYATLAVTTYAEISSEISIAETTLFKNVLPETIPLANLNSTSLRDIIFSCVIVGLICVIIILAMAFRYKLKTAKSGQNVQQPVPSNDSDILISSNIHEGAALYVNQLSQSCTGNEDPSATYEEINDVVLLESVLSGSPGQGVAERGASNHVTDQYIAAPMPKAAHCTIF